MHGQRNGEILRRIAATTVSDAVVNEEMDSKAAEEVISSRACEIPLTSVLESCVLTPRFLADEGMRYKNGRRVRKARCIDDFTASFINGAAAPRGVHPS